jgi:hypothetical protein
MYSNSHNLKGITDYYSKESGFHLTIHNNTRLPLVKYEGVKVSTGFASNVAVKATNLYNSPWPYSNCRQNTSAILSTDSRYYAQTVKFSKYARKICFEICVQNEFIIPNCYCADPLMVAVNELTQQRVCTNLSEMNCVAQIRSQFDTTPLSNVCDKYCPFECDSQIFDASINVAAYPTDFYYGIIAESLRPKFATFNSTPSRESLADSIAQVNVYYETLDYTEISQTPSQQ